MLSYVVGFNLGYQEPAFMMHHTFIHVYLLIYIGGENLVTSLFFTLSMVFHFSGNC